MTETCESCGMPIESGRYCRHCVDETGALQDFDTRFERMVGWRLRERGGTCEAAEQATAAYMATMPAWRHHPGLRAKLA